MGGGDDRDQGRESPFNAFSQDHHIQWRTGASPRVTLPQSNELVPTLRESVHTPPPVYAPPQLAQPAQTSLAQGLSVVDTGVSAGALHIGNLVDTMWDGIDRVRQSFSAHGTVASRPFRPSVNTEIKAYDDEVHKAARIRLKRLLDLYGLVEVPIHGDGNCQFSSLSDQIYRSAKYHPEVRRAAVDRILQYPEQYSGFIPGNLVAYCEEMRKNGTWGDHVTLQAAADVYGLQINLLTSYDGDAVVEIRPCKRECQRELWMSFWAEVHYTSIYAVGDRHHSPPEKAKQCLIC